MGKGSWVDLSGMICPYEVLNQLLDSIETNEVTTLEEVSSALKMMHDNYYNYEWTWCVDVLEEFYKKPIGEFTSDDIVIIVEKWRKSVLEIDQFLYEDAKKEFSMIKKTGFGVDGQKGDQELDFAEVRGEFEQNETVRAIKLHMERKENLGEDIISLMNRVEDIRININ